VQSCTPVSTGGRAAGVEPARADEVAFTAPYVLIEGVYAVPDRSRRSGRKPGKQPGAESSTPQQSDNPGHCASMDCPTSSAGWGTGIPDASRYRQLSFIYFYARRNGWSELSTLPSLSHPICADLVRMMSRAGKNFRLVRSEVSASGQGSVKSKLCQLISRGIRSIFRPESWWGHANQR
jgi:hypothetical protein